ncbi:hypothetical protein [Sphingomonas sp. BAUL-RG-20F-R05-02]|uniref:hypothetical protein n=1 Tax=Sphingomonas sp. BAUL-RG-20F-R05-02 TaxID=2914830 RepID=UPI001F5623C2|nr:hypothetical protein [Sphingomonas sp. BAUL-RG-20F-R05-02]
MAEMLSGTLKSSVHLLASLDPGAGKTEALCSFLRSWKADHFSPAGGALVVLATHKEIQSCIDRAGLETQDFAVLIHKNAPLASIGSTDPAAAPVLFTTREMLHRRCQGKTFAETSCYYYLGRPRTLKVWDEAFMPAKDVTLRKDLIVQPLAELRLRDFPAARTLEALGDSLSADRIGQATHVALAVSSAPKALQTHLGLKAGDHLSALQSLAGREGVVVDCNGLGLHLAGAVMPLPEDFAPCLILDASGRVRETYMAMETAGTLKRLPGFTAGYSGLRVRHWNRAASRSTLKDDEARREVLSAVSDIINEGDDAEPWLIIHAQDRDSYSIVEELRGLTINPERLAFLHWGSHHGTNEYRHIRRVVVLGLWRQPSPTYSALHIAAGGPLETAAVRETVEAIKAGEHRHNLLQAVCRSSIREGKPCEVYIVDKLKGAAGLLTETFPGAVVSSWNPEGLKLPTAALRLSMAIEEGLRASGGGTVTKRTVMDLYGASGAAFRKTVTSPAMVDWMGLRGLRVATRYFEDLRAA